MGGDLRSTYQALETQRILIDFNTGQTFANYYSVAELNLIRNYVLQYLHSNETAWWAEQGGLSVNEATFFTSGILTIIGASELIDSIRLVSFIESQISGTITIDPWLIAMVRSYQAIILTHPITITPNHAMISDRLLSVQTMTPIRFSITTLKFFKFVAIMKTITLRTVFMDHPILQPHYAVRSVSIVVCNWISTEYITDLKLTGENGITYSSWIDSDQIYANSICPEYSPTHPNLWNWGISFQLNSISYIASGYSNTSYEFTTACVRNATAPNPMTIQIYGSGSILDSITATAHITANAVNYSFPATITRETGSLVIQSSGDSLSQINLSTGTYEIFFDIWNTPAPFWNNSEGKSSLEYRGKIEYVAPTIPTEIKNNNTVPNADPPKPNSTTVENTIPLISLDSSSLSTAIIGCMGSVAGVTIFVRNTKSMKIYKKKQ